MCSEDNRKTIRFYRERDEYGEFSNFFKEDAVDPITDPDTGLTYATTEHVFQAFKFPPGTEEHEAIRTAKSAMDTKRAGRSFQMTASQLDEWEGGRDYEVMLLALRWKFTQWPRCRKVLMKSGSAKLVEDAKQDAKWGVGRDGTGRNLLGKALMQVRDDLRESRVTADA